MKRACAHLQSCTSHGNFSSWRALCTFLSMIPSLQDQETLELAERNISILEYLNPIWKSSAVFEVPLDVFTTCIRLCGIHKISWMRFAALKCVISMAMNMGNQAQGIKPGVAAESMGRPGCVDWSSISCNEYDFKT